MSFLWINSSLLCTFSVMSLIIKVFTSSFIPRRLLPLKQIFLFFYFKSIVAELVVVDNNHVKPLICKTTMWRGEGIFSSVKRYGRAPSWQCKQSVEHRWFWWILDMEWYFITAYQSSDDAIFCLQTLTSCPPLHFRSNISSL